MLPEGTMLQDGKFLVGQKLGAGGFGVTYRANHTKLKAPVVIKEFFPAAQVRRVPGGSAVEVIGDRAAFERGLRMFLREAELLFGLHHPNIVRVTDFFEEGGTAYIVMEYLPGRSMAEELRALEGRRITDQQVREWMGSLVDALGAIHRRSICHLDIKPDNIMCLPNGTIKLIDFGAAKQGTTLATQSRFVLTPAFAPPEMFEESSYGPESDIYELGVVLHLLVTGTMPPTALARLTSQARFFPREIGGGYGILIDQALRLNRADRPRDVSRWWNGASEGATGPGAARSTHHSSASSAWMSSTPAVTADAPPGVSGVTPSASSASRVSNPTDVLTTSGGPYTEPNDPLVLMFMRFGLGVLIGILLTGGVFAAGGGAGILLMQLLGSIKNVTAGDYRNSAGLLLIGTILCVSAFFLHRWKSSLR